MGNLPTHPALVHLPLGIAFVMPLVLIAVLYWLARDRPTGGMWLVAVLLQALLLGSAVAALRTGEAEEERVERVVPESALEVHEERGEVFTWLAGANLGALALLPIFRRRGPKGAVAAAALALSVAVAVQGVRVGHAGGVLVYEHGAANAYIGAKAPGAGAPRAAYEHDDD